MTDPDSSVAVATRPTDPFAIAIAGLKVRRGGRLILDDVSLGIRSGTVTGLLGPSGSGKTTLIRSIVGVQIVESGTVTVLGEPAGSKPLRSRVGYVTQSPAVYTDLTVRENLRYFARVLGVDASRVDEALATVDLVERAGQLTATLSGGQRARVSLATALLNDPDLLVLDEPTVGLDPVLRHELWESFRGLAARGKTLLVSSHVMDEASRCDDLLLLRDCKLVAALTPDELRARTGEDDLESAFLHLVQEEDAS
jgi:ABC-2 type transport system ATP-binding protein